MRGPFRYLTDVFFTAIAMLLNGWTYTDIKEAVERRKAVRVAIFRKEVYDEEELLKQYGKSGKPEPTP